VLDGAPERSICPPIARDLPIPSHRGGRKGFSSLPSSRRALSRARAEGERHPLHAPDRGLRRPASSLLGATTLLVGTPVAGRGHAEVEGLIGFFVNTLVLRADLDGELPFRELLARVKEQSLGAYSHADLPFERLVQEIAPERDLGRSALFQVMFVFQSATREAPSPAISGAPPRRDHRAGTAKFDLTLAMNEGATSLGGSFEYALDLFEEATIERMALHLHHAAPGHHP
jgi:non-ribosomal peptide synthetase component F